MTSEKAHTLDSSVSKQQFIYSLEYHETDMFKESTIKLYYYIIRLKNIPIFPKILSCHTA